MKILFFDLETTGVDTKKDRIVSIAMIFVGEDGKKYYFGTIINPTIEIPETATAVHGITTEEAQKYPTFADQSKGILRYFMGADILCGYNSNRFDLPLIVNEFARSGIDFVWSKKKLLDVKNLYTRMRPRTLTAAYKDLVNPEGFENAHDAQADTTATMDLLAAMRDTGVPDEDGEVHTDLGKLCDLSNIGGEIVDLDGKFKKDENGNIVYNFGAHFGKKVTDELGFAKWMLSKDFSNDTLRVVKSFFTKPNK